MLEFSLHERYLKYFRRSARKSLQVGWCGWDPLLTSFKAYSICASLHLLASALIGAGVVFDMSGACACVRRHMPLGHLKRWLTLRACARSANLQDQCSLLARKGKHIQAAVIWPHLGWKRNGCWMHTRTEFKRCWGGSPSSHRRFVVVSTIAGL